MCEDVRACLELLEEQMASLGTRCPEELLDSYDGIVPYLSVRDDATDSPPWRPDS